MDRKLFGIFSGRQLTAIAITAILAPSVLYGAVATQAVSITDPNSGKQAYVDSSRRLSVYDPVAGFANYPGNYVDIDAAIAANTCAVVYTPPSGKALIVTAITGNWYPDTTGSTGYNVETGACGGKILITNAISGTAAIISSIQQTFGTGVPFSGGVAMNNVNQDGYVQIHGYLVPDGAVPSAATSANAPRRLRLPTGRAS